MYSTMTPIKAFAWTSACVLACSFLFWSGISHFVKAPFQNWRVNLFYLCLFVPLSLHVYRLYRYRKGFENSFFENIPKSQKRGSALVGSVILICVATFEIALATLNVSDHRLVRFASASVWLVLGADRWRRYLELRGPEVSPTH